VAHAHRDVHRFVLAEQELLVAARDGRGAFHDGPVFGAMVMHLQRQTRARIDDDPLHLKALAAIDRVVTAPRTPHQPMRVGFRAAFGLDPCHQRLDALNLLAVHHQHRIGRLDHRHVADADARDEPALGMRVARGCVLEHHAPASGVAVRVLVERGPHGVPRTEIGPAGVERHRDGRRRFGERREPLHHRVVDRVRRTRGERLRGRMEAVRRGGAVADRGDARVMNLRRKRGDRTQPHAGAHDVDPAVPPVRPGRDVMRGDFRRGLLDERIERERARGAVQRHRHAGAQIAEARIGMRRPHAERREATELRVAQRRLHRALERGRIGDRVIGRHHRQHRIAVPHARKFGRERHGGRRVAPRRLDDHLRAQLARRELAHRDVPMRVAAHHLRSGQLEGRGQTAHATQRRFQQRFVADELRQLLRMLLARHRPQPRARAAGQDHRHDRGGAPPRPGSCRSESAMRALPMEASSPIFALLNASCFACTEMPDALSPRYPDASHIRRECDSFARTNQLIRMPL
jgi:hypothetical protein